jgi:FemAB-related protein (PEP-CTERM system-associated)
MLTDVAAEARGRPVDGAVSVAAAVEADRAAWDAFVSGARGATGYHEWAWRTVVERTFGHRCLYLVARRGPRIEGVLPLVQINSLLFGRTMTSLPFVNYGGVLATSTQAAQALVAAAADEARAGGCRHVELRHFERQFPELPYKQHKVTMRLALQPGMWEQVDRKVRNQVRKAEKSQLTVERGGVELLGDFYTVFARNMRDLGTPVYARRLFEEVLRAFPDRARLTVVRLQRQPIAAGLTYRTGTTVEVPWASSVRDYNSLCPNHLLYWHAIETAIAEGGTTFDFGRSTPGEGTFKFKEQWGAVAVPLHWEYRLLHDGGLPDQSPKNPKFQIMIAMWQRCPLWLANTLGPHIVRSIP